MENKLIEDDFKLSLGTTIWLLILSRISYSLIYVPFYLIGYFQSNIIIKSIFLCSSEILGNIFMVWSILRYIRSDYSHFNIKYISKFSYTLVSGILFLIIGYRLFFNNSLGLLLEHIPVNKSIEQAFRDLVSIPIVGFISICILAPIFEEILYRGILLEGFLNKYSPMKAILISALIFGIIHGNIHQFVNATILGIFLGIIYYKSNSLVLCILAHFFNNSWVYISDVIPKYISILPTYKFILGLLIFILGGYIFYKNIKSAKIVCCKKFKILKRTNKVA